MKKPARNAIMSVSLEHRDRINQYAQQHGLSQKKAAAVLIEVALSGASLKTGSTVAVSADGQTLTDMRGWPPKPAHGPANAPAGHSGDTSEAVILDTAVTTMSAGSAASDGLATGAPPTGRESGGTWTDSEFGDFSTRGGLPCKCDGEERPGPWHNKACHNRTEAA